MKPRIVVLSGGSSSEREISLQSAKEVLKHIDTQKYNVKSITIPEKKDIQWVKDILEFSPDLIFNLLHGGYGEDGSVAGLINCLDIPSVGNKVLSGSVCINKNMCKTVLKNNGVPVCDDVFIKKEHNIIDYEEKIKELGFPVIVKPNNGGGSIGVFLAEDIEEVKNAVKDIIKNYSDDVIIEKFISGREVTCVIVQKKNALDVLPVIDISTDRKFYDYNAKYIDTSAKLEFSTLPEFIRKMIKDIAEKVFKIFECDGFCCVDFIVKDEQVYFIEVNTIPGFTPQSIVIRTLNKLNINISSFLDSIIENKIQ